MRVSRAAQGRRERETDEANKVHGRADCGHPEAERSGPENGRALPTEWNQRSNVLQLESKVRRYGRQRRTKAEAPGRGERQAEARGRRSDARQCRAERL